jgi:hypothetical protein
MSCAPAEVFRWSDEAIETAARLLCRSVMGARCAGPACPCWDGRRLYADLVLSAALEAEREATQRAGERVLT